MNIHHHMNITAIELQHSEILSLGQMYGDTVDDPALRPLLLVLQGLTWCPSSQLAVDGILIWLGTGDADNQAKSDSG